MPSGTRSNDFYAKAIGQYSGGEFIVAIDSDGRYTIAEGHHGQLFTPEPKPTLREALMSTYYNAVQGRRD